MKKDQIYVLGPAGGPYKVGHSVEPTTRLATLQIGRESRLIMHHCAHYEGVRACHLEKFAHRLLAEHRINGEWFDVSISQAIDAIELAHRILLCRTKRPSADEPIPLRKEIPV